MTESGKIYSTEAKYTNDSKAWPGVSQFQCFLFAHKLGIQAIIFLLKSGKFFYRTHLCNAIFYDLLTKTISIMGSNEQSNS